MKTQFLTVLGLIAALSARAAIRYFDGPAFGIPLDFTQVEPLDLDANGSADINFSAGPGLSSGFNSYTPTYVAAVPGNAVLGRLYYAVILSPGASIGPDSTNTTGGAWTTNDLALATFSVGFPFTNIIFTPDGPVTNSDIPTWAWSGPLVNAGSGFLAARFQALDGTHYGWIHAAFINAAAPLPNASPDLQSGPIILDWGYETQPDTAILAGAAPVVPLHSPAIIRPGYLRLQWPSQPGAAYQIQSTTGFTPLIWSSLNFTVIATAASSSIDVPLTASNTFFRVLQSN